MFSHHGPDRSFAQNRALAAFLALNAGFVNSAGFVVVGFFSSHVTGTVGRFADEVALGNGFIATGALLLVLAFGFGAFFASTVLQSTLFKTLSTAYAVALALESALLFSFVVVRTSEGHIALLCVAMGIQNSLVTLISSARVRTTHLTGVTTDLGIELAGWFQWYRHGVTERSKIFRRPQPPKRPEPTVALLLGTIVLAFFVGAVLGAKAGTVWQRRAMLFPASAILLAAFYALDSKRRNARLASRTSKPAH